MRTNLVEFIYDNFIQVVERVAKHKRCCIDECSFEYKIRKSCHHDLIEVIYVRRDSCDRCIEVSTIIDYTNICFEYLLTSKWAQYIKSIAKEFVKDICPKKFIIVFEEEKKCRPQLPIWKPHCGVKTTTICCKEEIIEKPKIIFIRQKKCECAPICKPHKCPKKHYIICK